VWAERDAIPLLSLRVFVAYEREKPTYLDYDPFASIFVTYVRNGNFFFCLYFKRT
jgi:hypothetical protein